jgi:hypothetical protein
MALCLDSLALLHFSQFIRLSKFFGLSISEETLLVEMRIWCIKIGIVLVLHDDKMQSRVLGNRDP